MSTSRWWTPLGRQDTYSAVGIITIPLQQDEVQQWSTLMPNSHTNPQCRPGRLSLQHEEPNSDGLILRENMDTAWLCLHTQQEGPVCISTTATLLHTCSSPCSKWCRPRELEVSALVAMLSKSCFNSRARLTRPTCTRVRVGRPPDTSNNPLTCQTQQ